jgi:hypothetical protein
MWKLHELVIPVPQVLLAYIIENISVCRTDTTQQKPPHPNTSGWKQIPFTKHIVMSRIMITDTA